MTPRKLKQAEKEHFEQGIINSYKKIWDLEFMRKQIKNMREQYRITYDRLTEQTSAFEVRIQKLKERNNAEDPEEITLSEKKMDELNKDREQLKAQMDAADNQINGYDKDGQHFEGMNETIDAHQSNIALFKEHITTL